MDTGFVPNATAQTGSPAPQNKGLREAALQLEASFLAEMLRAAKLGQPPEEFGGGIGEEQFSSLLVDTYAQKLVERGGIGLAEHIFEAIKKRGET